MEKRNLYIAIQKDSEIVLSSGEVSAEKKQDFHF